MCSNQSCAVWPLERQTVKGERRSVTQNNPVLVAQSGLSGHLDLYPHDGAHPPLCSHQSELSAVHAVSCLQPISDIFQTKCRMVLVQDDRICVSVRGSVSLTEAGRWRVCYYWGLSC